MLYIASDHGGYKLKKRIIRYLENELKTKVEDLGPFEFNKTDDYPDYASKLAKKVLENGDNKGIAICRNGIGVCVTANKFKGIRAGIGYNIAVAKSMRNDDNANILCLAADHLSEEHAMAIVKKWLEIPFDNAERYVRRLKKIEEIENNQNLPPTPSP